MESILATGSDGQQLIPQLDPKVLTNQASYIVSRSQSTTTSPIPVAGPSGVRTIKWNIVDANFLDLSSLHFSFTVKLKWSDDKSKKLASLIFHLMVRTPEGPATGIALVVVVWDLETIYEAWLFRTFGSSCGISCCPSDPVARMDSML